VRIGIITALKPEARVFRRASGLLCSEHEYTVTIGGAGRENAARTANQLIRNGYELLISWGVAGALVEHLGAGDLLIGSHAMTGTGELLKFDQQFERRVLSILEPSMTVHTGTVVTVADAATSARSKAHLRRRFGADAVDMESTAIAYVARSAGVGYLCARSIVDAADFNVPQAAIKGLDKSGQLRPLKSLQSLAENPRQFPEMITLARNFRRSLKTLRNVARQLTD